MSAVANQIIGAVISTIGAVVAVFITDWVRNRRKATNDIPARLRTDRDYANNRSKTIQSALTAATGAPFIASKAMRFDIQSYQQLVSEAFSHLKPEQRKQLANITFAMSEADNANAETLRLSDLTTGSVVENGARREQAMLGRVHDLIDAYFRSKRGE